ncbi:MAG: TonB-dependent receptor domain-containing protein, partial [Thermoanaerobaculia bacterium]
TARAGARLAQLPKHSISLWNKVDLSQTWGLGLGIVHRDEIFTSTDNTVTLPAFTRVDAAVFYSFGPHLRAQLNVENLLDTTYYASAHSNTNISPGAPRTVQMSWTTRF